MLIFAVLILLEAVSFQAVQVNTTEPCFLNFSAGADMWRQCGMGDDFLQTSLLGWEWVTGGYFTMVIVGLFSLISYIKYHKAVYPLMILTMFLPVSFFLFPVELIVFVGLFTTALIASLLYFVFNKQTKEFG